MRCCGDGYRGLDGSWRFVALLFVDAKRSDLLFPVAASSNGVSASTASSAVGADSDVDVAHRYSCDMWEINTEYEEQCL